MANRKGVLTLVGVGVAALTLWALRGKAGAGGEGVGVVLRVIDLQTGREVGTVGGAGVMAVYYGDPNGDGVVDMGDLLTIEQYVAGLAVPTQDQFRRADVNGDGTLDMTDVLLVEQYIAGFITQFPVETLALAFQEGGAYQVQAAVTNRSVWHGQPVGVTLDIELWGETLVGVEVDFLPRATMEVEFAASEEKVVLRDFTVPMGRGGTDGRIHARLYPGPDATPYDPGRLLAEAVRAFSVQAALIVRDVSLASIRFTRQVDLVDAPLVGGVYQVSEGDAYTATMQLLVTKTQGGVGLPVDVAPRVRVSYSSGISNMWVLAGRNVPSGSTVDFTQTLPIPSGQAGVTGILTIQVYLDGQPASEFAVPLAIVAAPVQYGGLITLARSRGR